MTGYIAGDAASVIYAEHPDWSYTFLVRTQDKAEAVQRAFPGTRTVVGDLDSTELLEKEAAEADIVLRTSKIPN